MKIWIDAHVAPVVATWLKTNYEVEAVAVRDLGLLRADDQEIFEAAKEAAACVMTKDRDFCELVHRLGPPPQILWLTCGNTSSDRLRKILAGAFPRVLELLRQGEPLIEITDPVES